MKWNTAVTVVDIVEAETELGATGNLVARLQQAGFEIYEGNPPDAFLSEDQ